MSTTATTVSIAAEPFSLASVRRAIAPPALALVYLWAVAWLGQAVSAIRHGAGAPVPLAWAELIAALVLVGAVPVVSLFTAHALGAVATPSRRDVRARWAAHLAFTSPSLLVAFGNYARILNARPFVTAAWVTLWVACIAGVLIGGSAAAAPARAALARRFRARSVHAGSAVALVAVFLLPHMGNHVTAIWSGRAHMQVMAELRTVYRSFIIEPLLVALLVLQAATGLLMLLSRVRGRTTEWFQTLQTTSGLYLAVFLLSHLAAAFSARAGNVDTNWLWLVGRSGTLLASPVLTVVPHYFLGPLLLFVHVACGVRNRRLAAGRSRAGANRLAIGTIAAGAAVSVVIMAALFGIHVQR